MPWPNLLFSDASRASRPTPPSPLHFPRVCVRGCVCIQSPLPLASGPAKCLSVANFAARDYEDVWRLRKDRATPVPGELCVAHCNTALHCTAVYYIALCDELASFVRPFRVVDGRQALIVWQKYFLVLAEGKATGIFAYTSYKSKWCVARVVPHQVGNPVCVVVFQTQPLSKRRCYIYRSSRFCSIPVVLRFRR